MNKIALFFPRFANAHFVKDVFVYPYAISNKLSRKLVVFSDMSESSSNSDIEDVEFKRISNSKSTFLHQALCVWQSSRKFKMMIFFHFRWYSIFLCFIYKLRNPEGVSYIKGDLSVDEAEAVKSIFFGNEESRGKIKKYIVWFIFRYLSRFVDLLTVETTDSLAILKSVGENLKVKNILYSPNGFNQTQYHQERKEKVILNVARIGTEQKNTELLLDVLTDFDLHDWHFYFLGTVEPSFLPKIERFFKDNPNKVGAVKFIGEVKNKSTLDDYFIKSSIFCFSSRYESYGLVLSEAAYFNNYVITTDVGAASDLINNSEVRGCIVDSDTKSFKHALSSAMEQYPMNINNDLTKLSIDNVVSEILDKISLR